MPTILDKPRILIVEDEKTIADYMKVMLSKEGYCCVIVATGEEAVDIALKTRPDLILMDIRLGGMIDGIIAYEQIKKYVEIPVVFVSGYGDKNIIARAMQCKPIGYLVKPFKIAQILSEINKAFEWHQLRLKTEVNHESVV